MVNIIRNNFIFRNSKQDVKYCRDYYRGVNENFEITIKMLKNLKED